MAEPPSRSRRSAPRKLVVWDFDWSLVDENSDTFVIHELEPSGELWRRVRERRREWSDEWTQLMDWSAGELHALGKREADIRRVIASLPVLDGALGAVERARAAGCTQRILSDANTVYISHLLATRPELGRAISAVETNRAEFDGSGRLRISAHQQGAPHRCPRCPPNLCKGRVLSRWLVEEAPSVCVYVGDGHGDFCAAVALRPTDVLLARREPHAALLDACREQPALVRARVVEWGGDADPHAADLLDGMRRALGEAA